MAFDNSMSHLYVIMRYSNPVKIQVYGIASDGSLAETSDALPDPGIYFDRGLKTHPDKDYLYVSQSDNTIKVFDIQNDGGFERRSIVSFADKRDTTYDYSSREGLY